MTIDRVEFDLQQFLAQYQTIKTNFDNELDFLERDIATIERSVQIKVCHSFVAIKIRISFLVFLVKTIRYCFSYQSIK